MKIFLGYASEHVATARVIHDYLKTLSADVWFDKEALVGGDDWDRERDEAQRKAEFVVHLISDNIFARPGVVNREIKQTLRLVEDQPIGASYALFVRLDDVRMPAELLRFQYIDFFEGTWREQIAKAVSKRRDQLGGGVLRIAPEMTTRVTEAPLISADRDRISRVDSSVSTEHYVVSSNHLQYLGSGIYWDYVNARLAAEALGGFIGAISDFNRMDEVDKIRIKEYNAPYEWSLSMQEFFRHDDFVSTRSLIFSYMGGAHPNYGITTLNFLGPKFGLCSINNLLGHNEEKAFRLIEYCKKVLLAMFDDEGIKEFVSESFSNTKFTWSLASQFNFDTRGLTINFSPYDVLPFAFGSHEVFVPWRFATPLLDEHYRGLEDELSE